MKTDAKFFQLVDKLAYLFAAVSIGGMLTCVTIQVFARHSPLSINWTTELSQYCFLWSTSFASYIAARRNKLIGVELVQKQMPAPVRRVMKCVSWGCAVLFYGMVIYYCCLQLPTLLLQRTPMLKWSMGMIYIIMMLGLGMLTVYCCYLAVMSLVTDDSKKETVKKTAAEIAEEVE